MIRAGSVGIAGTDGSVSLSYMLSVVLAGTGTGTVTSTPAGINCGATCASSFNAGTVVQWLRDEARMVTSAAETEKPPL